MKINYEILNYLNLISESLGDLYLKGKYNPFPDDFVMSEEMIKERLTLSEKQTTFPEFLYDDKEEITKHIKIFIKNIKNAENYLKNNKKMQKNMKNRLFLYFNCYFTLAENILKNMKKSDFEEEKAFNDLLNIDPILSELLENFYELDIDISAILDKIEDDYYKLFEELEEKKKAKRKQLDNALLMQKTTEKVLGKAKKVEKSKTLSKKTEKEQKEPIKTQKKEKVKQTTKTERERI